jgi:hypothetical protein
MDKLKIAINALDEVVRLWKRSNKRDRNTCQQSFKSSNAKSFSTS